MSGGEGFAVECVQRVLDAAAALCGGAAVTVDPLHVAAAVRSERHMRVGGEALAGFAPLSRFWRAADGWVRTHANYPWHRDALLCALRAEAERVEAAIAALPATEIEARVYAAGGLAVAVRTAGAWRAEAGDPGPLVATAAIAGAAPRPAVASGRPVTGLRVLDLTRVIAGPVATRMLGALGADVLRIDDPNRPELEMHQLDGLLGKRSAFLDLRTAAGRERLEDLLAGADVVVTGYRPGALTGFGLDPDALARRHPGLVIVALSAWGNAKGFAGRRGFDSLVQAASGIALDYGDPGALPCQLLDHATGYLMAAASLEGVARQRAEGGTHVARLALAATAAHVLDGRRVEDVDPDPAPYLQRLGDVVAVAPPGAVAGEPLRWPGPPAPYGAAEPAWS
ncbi:MAG: hypothetical protein QOF76_393 [Solirubrobacteraceae bacterium]|jgi:hypothetical protein|nr:hypothetical protein [Solirubrobacteraceae bacterium]